MKNLKKKHGIILVVIGIVMIAASMYINSQVLHGRQQLSSAQSMKDTGDKYGGTAGKFGGAMMQGKIDEGSAKAANFAKISMALKVIGIIAVVAGGVIIFVKRKKS